MREERSLSYAKQSFKRNMYKYLAGDNFENVISEYYIREDEIESLLNYIKKLVSENDYKDVIKRIEYLKENY